MKIFVFFLGLISFYSACGPKQLRGVDYLNWIETEGNGYYHTLNHDGNTFSLLYKPATYIALKERKGNILNLSEFEERIHSLSKLHYFTLRLKVNSLATSRDKVRGEQQHFGYLSSGIQEDIKLVMGKDTSYCAMFHYEQSYGISPFQTMILAFEPPMINTPLKDNPVLVVQDRIMGIGTIQFTLPKNAFNEPPHLIYP